VLDRQIARALNQEQLEAVSALRGPVCILAGAGTGKTTTITRRIAHQVRSGEFLPQEILAVTFTTKAAGEMVSRLAALSVREVRARTFHSEALAQYQRFADEPREVLGAKGAIVASLMKSLPPPYRFTSLRDIATEIEWAKNRRLKPSTYESSLGPHEPPIPQDLMARVFSSYEKRKAATGQLDFEDLLGQTIAILENDESALISVRERYRAFTVDEYQDVNLLQQTLLDLWVGDREDVCVVGDDHQSIFGFTGATPSYLLGFPERHPGCKVVSLTRNYRSTPQVLTVANKLVPGLGGHRKRLEASMPEGPPPTVHRFADAEEEVEFIVRAGRELSRTGVPWEEIAVLYRINGRSEDLEQAFAEANIPYQVKDSLFLRRPAAKALMAKLRRQTQRQAAPTVLAITDDLGYTEDEEFSGDEATRQADLARLRALAEGFDGTVGEFAGDLRRRFRPEDSVKGVQILTYHRAKGLEFEAVFLPRVEERELPFVLAKTGDATAEERRLFYVGLTRAKRHLFLSWCAMREGERRKFHSPSPFLAELGWAPSAEKPKPKAAPKEKAALPEEDEGLFEALRSWRLEKSRELRVPAYVVFHDSTLAAIAAAKPKDIRALQQVSGVGPTKCERFGDEVIAVVASG
jgi:DNA helicase-2/ATP-dependent DNA helicase PcrA